MVAGALLAQRLVHRRMEVVGRVEVRAVVRGQLHDLHRPAFAVGQVFLLQAGKERQDAGYALVVIGIFDMRAKTRRIGGYVVLQRHRDVDEFARHDSLLISLKSISARQSCFAEHRFSRHRALHNRHRRESARFPARIRCPRCQSRKTRRHGLSRPSRHGRVFPQS